VIIHKVLNPAGWTAHPNSISEDRRISWRAKGILHYLLSRPPGWETDGRRLAEAGVEGRGAVYTALTELERAGYLERVKRQGAGGKWSTDVFVYDHPQQRLIGSPQLVEESVDSSVEGLGTTGEPSTEKPEPENREPLTTTENKKMETSQANLRRGRGSVVDKSAPRPSGAPSDAAEGGAAPAASSPAGGAESGVELALDDSDLRAIAEGEAIEPALSMFALRAHLRSALEDDSIGMSDAVTWMREARAAQPPALRLTMVSVLAVAVGSSLPTTAREGSTALSENDGLPADVS
jgi:hypothetical protein